jgi:HD-like signal output (HDOD) protein
VIKIFDYIIEKIDKLPPSLPKTFEEIENFRRKSNKEVEELVKIIEKDALLVSTLLKIVNSSLFGFRSKIETLTRIVNLLGVNFTIFIVINQSIKDTFKTNLSPYGISCEDFMQVSITSTILTKLWLEEIKHEFREDIFLASILQETGKFILSELIIGRNLSEEFIKLLQDGMETKDAENKLLNITTSQVTAEIFKYWQLSSELINMIRFVDDINNCPVEYKQKAQILDVIKTACQANSLLSDSSVEKALKKAVEYKLELEPLEKVIQTLQERLLD